MAIVKIIIIFGVIKMCWSVINSNTFDDHSVLIDKKNISWVVGIFKASLPKRSHDPYMFQCQGILMKPTIVYTTDLCVGVFDDYSNLKVRIYDWNDLDSKNPMSYQQRDVGGIGYKRIYLSSGQSIPVKRLSIIYLTSSFDLHSDFPLYPIQQSLKSSVISHVDTDNCRYISLVANETNELSLVQYKAKYVSDKQVCCLDSIDNNGIDDSLSLKSDNCIRCNIGRDIFCGTFSEQIVNHPLNRKWRENIALGGSLACKDKAKNSIFVMGILVDVSECTPRYVKL